jgi:lysozyme
MKMSADGRAKLIAREGFRLTAYKDSVGVLTIGVGHTAAAGKPYPAPGMQITKAEVDRILAQDLVQFEDAVSGAVRVPLAQGQFDALVSLAFNIGTGGFRKSTVVRRLNEGNYRAAADAFLLWNKPAEIMGRRRSERAQFLAATDKAGAGAPVRYIPASHLHGEEAVSADYLRASGSRTITAADRVKQAAAGIGVGDALAAASQAKDYATQAHDVAQGFHAGAPPRELVESYWPFLLAVLATLAVAALVFLAWAAAQKIQAARVDDAVYPDGEAAANG